MRVAKKADGTFVIEDEPLRLYGSDATAFLEAMKLRDAAGNNDAQRRFQEQCAAVYRKTKP